MAIDRQELPGAGHATQLDAAAVKRDGRRQRRESGRGVLHPGIAKARQTTLALAKVLSDVQMEQGLVKNPVKQAAAQVRWRQHNATKAEAAVARAESS